MNILVDHFGGDPDACYTALAASISDYQIPDVTFDWHTETRIGFGMFAGVDETARCLAVQDTIHRSLILAYRYGAHFFLSLRHEYLEPHKILRHQEKDNHRYLDQVKTACFRGLIDRAVDAGFKQFVAETRVTESEEDTDAVPRFEDLFIEV